MDIARLVLLLIVALRLVEGGPPVFNVVDYGAAGNGKTDDTKAFLRAWGYACTSPRSSTFLIPSGRTFLLSEVVFGGPCRSNMHIQVSGNIVAPNGIWTNFLTNFLTFININRLTMDGSGQIDGRGPIWWACLAQRRCKAGPSTLGFLGCNDLRVSGIKIKDSPGKQLTVYKSVGVRIAGVTITAPEDSPNTDGMLITESQHVQVLSSTIGTGDDCIAIGPGSSDVNISGITCGPGHGISIGSLGGSGSKAMVEQIHVSHSHIFQSLTGVRIKTWQGGSGFAKDVLFENINFTSVKTPIVIDQFYCPQGGCPNKTSSVSVSDVRFINLHGSASTDVAIKLACSQSVPCSGIVLEEVSFTLEGSRDPPRSYCLNARGSADGRVIPEVPCLK